MKKLFLTLSISAISLGVFAQEAEMKATQSAYKANNYAEALSQAEKAISLMGNSHAISAEDQADFYFTAAQSAQKTGDIVLAAEYFAKVTEMESNPYWKAKNKDTKNWEYFWNQSDANKVTSAGNYSSLKEGKLSTSLLAEIAPQLNDDANTALKLGNEAFKAKNYAVAGPEFVKAYYLYKSVGNKNELLKYYGALSYLQTDEKQKAAELLQSMVDSGFTGVQTNYFATDQDGKEVRFATKEDMETQVKLGLASNPRTEETESMEEELYSNTTYAWYSLENWDKTLVVGEKGLEKYPNNQNMSQIVSGTYFKSGSSEDFIKNLEAKIAKGTATHTDYFNLAKTMEDTGGDVELVKKYYKDAIAAKPDFVEAYVNLAYTIIRPEKEFVEKMNANLGTSANEKKIYNENKKKRKQLYLEALPYLEKAYQLRPNDAEIIKNLRNSYETVDNDEKFFEFKKMYESLDR